MSDLCERPLFCCQNENCAAEVSFYPEMLAVYNGKPICGDCYDNELWPLDEDDDPPRFSELPPFVPAYQAEIDRLRAELEEARGLILDLCDELEPYVEEKWGYDERLKRQYDRDMEPAVKGRAYLERQDRQ